MAGPVAAPMHGQVPTINAGYWRPPSPRELPLRADAAETRAA